MIQVPEKDTTRAEENLHLSQDLNTLWAAHHLTKNHGFNVVRCKHGHWHVYVTKDDKPDKPKAKLLKAIVELCNHYELDRLQAWPSATDENGNILFARIIGGVLHDSLLDGSGNVSDVRTTGKSSEPQIVKVWYIEPFGDIITEPVTFVDYQDDRLHGMHGDLASSQKTLTEACALRGYVIAETWGVQGMAALDPDWDGKSARQGPFCEVPHDAHEIAAEKFYLRGASKREEEEQMNLSILAQTSLYECIQLIAKTEPRLPVFELSGWKTAEKKS